MQRALAEVDAKDSLLSAWTGLNIEQIINQAALITGCNQQSVIYYLEEFHSAIAGLPSSASSSGTATGAPKQYCDEAVKGFADLADRALTFAVAGQHAHTAVHWASRDDRAKEFLTKWSYVSGQVLRDLTISSSQAFATMQLISLFVQ